MVQIRRELTDLLPIDLKFHFAYPEFVLRFDWRMYLSIFFDEQKRIAAADPDPVKAYMPYAKQLMDDVDRGEMDLVTAFKKGLERVLPSMQACSENAFVMTRRKRRLRIAMRFYKRFLQKDEEWREDYVTRGEKTVQKKMRHSRLFVDLEEFSDEEEELPDENAPEYWETTDDSEESSREADDSESDGEEDRESIDPGPQRPRQDIRNWFVSGSVPAKQQQATRKHQRQKSSFDAKMTKRTRTRK